MGLTLGKVKKEGLPGYQLKTGYLLVLKNGLAGTFPALISRNYQLFICTDKKILEKVWEKIKKRPAKVVEVQFYANESEGIGFDVNMGDPAEAITILSEEKFNELVETLDIPFKWAPGWFYLTVRDQIESPFA